MYHLGSSSLMHLLVEYDSRYAFSDIHYFPNFSSCRLAHSSSGWGNKAIVEFRVQVGQRLGAKTAKLNYCK
jgi:hypothetical protein